MMDIFGAIAHLLGSTLNFLYNNLWFSYGLAIVALTVIIKFILLPLSVKSFNSMARMQEVQPLMAEIQRKYKNDKEAMNREVLKLYQEKKVNPFGGCLPLLLQIPILYGLFLVISHPLTYVFEYKDLVNSNTYSAYVSKNDFYNEIRFIEIIQEDQQKASEIESKLKEEIGNNEQKTNLDSIRRMNMVFLGINLGDIPKIVPPKEEATKYLILWIVPILTGITTYISSKYNQLPTAQTEANAMQTSMQKQMMIMMPFMAAWFSFIVPAGLSLYWLVSNIFQMIQQRYLINTHLKKKEA